MNKDNATTWICNKIDRCDLCGKKAEYTLYAKMWYGVTKTRQICEEHKQRWYSGELNV
jgi:hypothetical protein